MRLRFFRSTTVLVVASAAALAACGDEVTNPDALLASAEAETVMRSAAALPSLPGLLDRLDPASTQDRALAYRARELWNGSLTAAAPGGESRRRLAVRYVESLLADGLEEADWADVEAGLEAWQGTAESMLRHLALPRVERHLSASRRHLERARRGRSDRAHALLLAASALAETTPGYLARSLTRQAEDAVAHADAVARAGGGGAPAGADAPGGGPSAVDLERARRLKDWAVRAVAEGDDLLAIQRAYYAIQLAEGQ